VHFQVLVKEVKEKVLPEVTDEWAGEASEFDTVEELRADIAKRMGLVKRVQATIALRNSALDAVVELVDSDPPEVLVNSEIQRRVHDLEHRLEAQQATVEQYLEATGQTAEQVVESMREGATEAVKADLALRAIAEAESIEPTSDDVDAEIQRMAGAYRMKPNELRRNLERADQMPAVRSDWKKSKALEWLIEHVEVVDPEGHPIDRALLEPDAEPETTQASASSEPTEASEAEAGNPKTGDPGEETGEP
jgi:trigger factor